MNPAGKSIFATLVLYMSVSALASAEPGKSDSNVSGESSPLKESLVLNASFETLVNPPAQKENGMNWVFRSKTIADSWVYQQNGGYAETCSDNPADGKSYLRVAPLRCGFPAFIYQNVKTQKIPVNNYLLTMKIRGNGSVEPFITVQSKTGVFGKTKFDAKVGEWTVVTHTIKVDEQGAMCLMFRITGESLDIDDVSLVPWAN